MSASAPRTIILNKTLQLSKEVENFAHYLGFIDDLAANDLFEATVQKMVTRLGSHVARIKGELENLKGGK